MVKERQKMFKERQKLKIDKNMNILQKNYDDLTGLTPFLDSKGEVLNLSLKSQNWQSPVRKSIKKIYFFKKKVRKEGLKIYILYSKDAEPKQQVCNFLTFSCCSSSTLPSQVLYLWIYIIKKEKIYKDKGITITMEYQYQLAIGLTKKIIRHYYNNIKYLFIRSPEIKLSNSVQCSCNGLIDTPDNGTKLETTIQSVKDKSHLEKALEETNDGEH